MSSPHCSASKDRDTETLLPCKLCLEYVPLEHMTTISQCQCIFCNLCLKQYIELLVKEGLQTGIICPDSACSKQGRLLENEIEFLVAVDVMQRYKRLQLEGEVLLDPWRTWCPSSSCQAVCQLQEAELPMPQLVQCPLCSLCFCSACHADWHTGQTCQGSLPIVTSHPAKNSISSRSKEDEVSIKRCPRCSIFIERDEGCAQMLCKNCKHAFCWYCLESLDDDFLLIHYDKGSCKNKLGHSRAAVIWHRTQLWQLFRPELEVWELHHGKHVAEMCYSSSWLYREGLWLPTQTASLGASGHLPRPAPLHPPASDIHALLHPHHLRLHSPEARRTPVVTHRRGWGLSGSVGRLWPSGSLAGVDGAVGQGQGSCAGSRLSLQSASACPGSPTGSWHHAAGISPNYNYQLQLQMETSRRTSRCILHGLQPPPHSTPQKA